MHHLSIDMQTKHKFSFIMQFVYPFVVLSIFRTCYAECDLPRFRRMVQGKKAEHSEWSFAAWIIKDKNGGFPRYCGGSLVSRNWVLTAAHCVDSVVGKPWKLKVNIGSSNRVRMRNTKKFLYHVNEIILNPGYNKDIHQTDDVALIRLNRSVPISKHSCIKVGRIAHKRIKDGKESQYICKAAGWGKYQTFGSQRELYSYRTQPSIHLKEIEVPLIPLEKCFGKRSGGLLRNQSEVEKMLCGGSKNPIDGTACLHDSGSPLVCIDKCGDTHLEGVAIAITGPDIVTNPCKPGKQVIIFMRVAHYYEWITETIKPKLQ